MCAKKKYQVLVLVCGRHSLQQEAANDFLSTESADLWS